MEEKLGCNISGNTSDNLTCFNQTSISVTTDSTTKLPVYFKDNFLFCYYGSLQFLTAYETFFCYVTPILSIIGIVINTLCVAMLRKSGLGKPSNILLLALVIADSMNLILNINFADKLRMFGPVKSKNRYCTWEYDSMLNNFIFVAYQSMFAIGQWGHFVNSIIPIIITVERMLAVYFPVTFKKVVTTRSVIVSCVLAYLSWLPWVVFQTFFRQLATVQLPSGKYVSYSTSTEMLRNNFTLIYALAVYASEVFFSWLPSSFVCIGCLLIAIRVKISMIKRQHLSKTKERQKWSPRTTRTLLMTCLFFATTHCISSLISALVPLSSETPLMTYFVVEISEFVNVLNCSSNFFIYILSNGKMWTIFIRMIHGK